MLCISKSIIESVCREEVSVAIVFEIADQALRAQSRCMRLAYVRSALSTTRSLKPHGSGTRFSRRVAFGERPRRDSDTSDAKAKSKQ
mmetsp:Transcript_11234/g.35795  ORF Transcript_11234/g.35795 Transcript_11234/m.35795 type:complete len:87 (+) Transcript_11234:235-495(+)